MTLPRWTVSVPAGAALVLACAGAATQASQAIDPLADGGHRALAWMLVGGLVTLVTSAWGFLRWIKVLRGDLKEIAGEAAREVLVEHERDVAAHQAARADAHEPIYELLNLIRQDQVAIKTLLIERLRAVSQRLKALEGEPREESGDEFDASAVSSRPRRATDPESADMTALRTGRGHRGRQ